MKVTLSLFALVGAALLAATTPLQAQYTSDVNPTNPPQPPPPGPPPGPRYYYTPYVVPGPLYVQADLGGTLMQHMRVKSGGPDITFNPGTRFDVAFGVYVAEPISFEFETGVLWNRLTDNSTQPLTENGQHADLYQVPLLANVVFHAPLGGGCQLYIGAGAGGVVSDIYVSTSNFHHGYTADSDASFAYQAMAGFRWPIARRMDVGVGYKFLGTLDHTWFDGDPNLNTHTGASYSHSILASFSLYF